VRPHPIVHRGDEKDFGLCREEAGSEQIIGEAVSRASDEISRRGRDDKDVSLAGEPDVIEGVSRPKDLRMNLTSGDRLEGDGTHEFTRGARHHDIYFSPGLCKQTRQPHGLVAGDAPGYTEEDAGAVVRTRETTPCGDAG
jgi:hypothetical protein